MSGKQKKKRSNLKITLAFSSVYFYCYWVCFHHCFVSLLVVLAYCAVEIKICAITSKIKMYKSIIKKRRKKHAKIVLLAKNKLDLLKILISKALIHFYINHDD